MYLFILKYVDYTIYINFTVLYRYFIINNLYCKYNKYLVNISIYLAGTIKDYFIQVLTCIVICSEHECSINVHGNK